MDINLTFVVGAALIFLLGWLIGYRRGWVKGFSKAHLQTLSDFNHLTVTIDGKQTPLNDLLAELVNYRKQEEHHDHDH
jgi:hypothetical protein